MGVSVLEQKPRSRSPAVAAVLSALLLLLVAGAVVVAARESQPARQVPGTLISIDHRDGGDSGTGVVTVRYVDDTGNPDTAQVVMTLSSWPSLDPGSPVTVYVRDGHAVNEPQHFVPALLLSLLQAVLLWLVLLAIVGLLTRRDPGVGRRHGQS